MKNEIQALKEAVIKDVKKGSKKDWILIMIPILIAIYGFVSGIGVSEANVSLVFGPDLRQTQREYDDLYRLQKSIEICEGYDHKESLAYRNNNHGNLKAGGKTDRYGHTIYPNPTQGYLAHLSLLKRKYWGQTPYQMNKRYATDKNWWKCVSYYYNDHADKYL